ncbi:hypothetical protein SAMN05444398_102219 [Roseovarius pacificus]|uniref:Uncharacterized protein n=1 Tax=Roseovarius pacificus TaxID=337701 RepID=A0A1M7A8Z1_9RHOB|nr:hypothetical protein SAMN05444398_102219 [Roseovarius pacificus]
MVLRALERGHETGRSGNVRSRARALRPRSSFMLPWQVSWLCGSIALAPFPMLPRISGFGPWLAAYSCGGSAGFSPVSLFAHEVTRRHQSNTILMPGPQNCQYIDHGRGEKFLRPGVMSVFFQRMSQITHCAPANAVIGKRQGAAHGRRIGKPVKIRHCPRNGKGVVRARYDHWGRGAPGRCRAQVRAGPHRSPETSLARDVKPRVAVRALFSGRFLSVAVPAGRPCRPSA